MDNVIEQAKPAHGSDIAEAALDVLVEEGKEEENA